MTDDQALVNCHVYGAPANDATVMHLRKGAGGEIREYRRGQLPATSDRNRSGCREPAAFGGAPSSPNRGPRTRRSPNVGRVPGREPKLVSSPIPVRGAQGRTWPRGDSVVAVCHPG